MWKSIALIMIFITALSAIVTGALAVEINGLKAEIKEYNASTIKHLDALSGQVQSQADFATTEFARVNDKMTQEITRLTTETQNSDRFHHSRDVREIAGQTNGSEMVMEDVTKLWEECLEERMGLMGVFYAADMVDWWQSDYWTDLSDDGRKADLLDTGRIHGCWE